MLAKLAATDTYDTIQLPIIFKHMSNIEKENETLTEWAWKFGFISDVELKAVSKIVDEPKANKRGKPPTPKTAKKSKKH